MIKIRAALSLIFAFMTFSSVAMSENARPALFASAEEKNEFVSVVSVLIEKAWKKWQDSVIINDVDVEGSLGMIKPGNMVEPLFESSEMLEDFDRTGKSQEYISCVRAVAKALENGMRNWQLGYTNDNVPFPQGASCSFTLTPCENVPVIIGSGQSTGDRIMKADALYNFMLYRTPDQSEDTLIVMRAVSSGIEEGFEEWKRACSIVGIVASGGIAPQPGPMGTGPGPVRGAKGNNGKLVGHYFDGERMRERAADYFLARHEDEGIGAR